MTCHAYHAHSSEATSNATPACSNVFAVSPTRLAREHVAICAMIGDDMHTQLVPDPRLCVKHEGCEHLQLTRSSSRWPKLCDMLHARSSQTLLPCVLKFERMLPRWESALGSLGYRYAWAAILGRETIGESCTTSQCAVEGPPPTSLKRLRAGAGTGAGTAPAAGAAIRVGTEE